MARCGDARDDLPPWSGGEALQTCSEAAPSFRRVARRYEIDRGWCAALACVLLELARLEGSVFEPDHPPLGRGERVDDAKLRPDRADAVGGREEDPRTEP